LRQPGTLEKRKDSEESNPIDPEGMKKYVQIMQVFQKLDLKGDELKSLENGFIENYPFLRVLEEFFPDQDSEPSTFVNTFLRSKANRGD
jgi:hypothetical protein